MVRLVVAVLAVVAVRSLLVVAVGRGRSVSSMEAFDVVDSD
jgi:hypothetical protein